MTDTGGISSGTTQVGEVQERVRRSLTDGFQLSGFASLVAERYGALAKQTTLIGTRKTTGELADLIIRIPQYTQNGQDSVLDVASKYIRLANASLAGVDTCLREIVNLRDSSNCAEEMVSTQAVLERYSLFAHELFIIRQEGHTIDVVCPQSETFHNVTKGFAVFMVDSLCLLEINGQGVRVLPQNQSSSQHFTWIVNMDVPELIHDPVAQQAYAVITVIMLLVAMLMLLAYKIWTLRKSTPLFPVPEEACRRKDLIFNAIYRKRATPIEGSDKHKDENDMREHPSRRTDRLEEGSNCGTLPIVTIPPAFPSPVRTDK